MSQLPVPLAASKAINAVITGQGHQDPTRRTIAVSPQWKSVIAGADGQTAQAAVIEVLQTRPGPLRTRDVRERINHNRQEPLVNERVYEALVALYQRGLVTRLKTPDRRHVYWQLPKTSGSRRKARRW
jgi:hypothetical protein